MKKLLTVLPFSQAQGFSWGLTGHRVIGHVAMEHLNLQSKHISRGLKGRRFGDGLQLDGLY